MGPISGASDISLNQLEHATPIDARSFDFDNGPSKWLMSTPAMLEELRELDQVADVVYGEDDVRR